MPDRTTFTSNWDTGAITVNHWDQETDITNELIDASPLFQRHGDTITIIAANGHAVYNVTGPGTLPNTVRARLVKSMLSEAGDA
jgi:hypothetical protein